MKGIIIKFIFITLAAIVLAWVSSLFYFAYFRPPKDKYMRGYFIGWRTQSGIESMTGNYKFKKKVYDPKDFDGRVGKFMDVTQNNSYMNTGKAEENDYHGLLDDYIPVHLPRKEINHHSFFESLGDMEKYYQVRKMVRRYANDKEFLEARKKLGTGAVTKDQLKKLLDTKEKRLLYDPNNKKLTEKFGKTAYIQGVDEFTKQLIEQFSPDVISKQKDNLFGKDFVTILEITNQKEFYNNLYNFMNSLNTKKYDHFTIPDGTKMGDKDYKKIGEQVKEKNKKLFADMDPLVDGIYKKKSNEFYDYRYSKSKNFNEMRDRNYNIAIMFADIGMGRPVTKSSFFFSSLAYSFYYATLNVPLEKISTGDKSKKKPPSRSIRVQYAFDYIFQNIYHDTSSEEYAKDQNWFLRKILLPKYVLFSTMKNPVYKESHVKNDAKTLMDGFKKNLQIS